MTVRSQPTNRPKAVAAFTLVEVVLSIATLALVMAGMIYGYVQSNYRAEWTAMSLAAQSLASKAVEQARAAKWDIHSGTPGTGPGTSDELPAPMSYFKTNSMVIPATGQTTDVVTTVVITSISTNPPARQIRADCTWYFPLNGKPFTNTVITWRGAY